MSKNENDPTVVTENNLVLSKVENASADCEDDSIRLQKRTRIRSIFSMLSGKDIWFDEIFHEVATKLLKNARVLTTFKSSKRVAFSTLSRKTFYQSNFTWHVKLDFMFLHGSILMNI